jgi:uncharacterized protein YukJ
MSLTYGVLRGQPDLWKREDGAKTPHLQIRVLDETGQPWRIAVNVQSGDKSEVVYWVVDPIAGHPVLNGLPALHSGFTAQPATSQTTLDFVKAPMFDFGLGRILPPKPATGEPSTWRGSKNRENEVISSRSCAVAAPSLRPDGVCRVRGSAVPPRSGRHQL